MYIVNLILQFFSRKVFIDYLGTDVLGLNTTTTNLLQFLNLAELGITSAVAFSLYKPLQDHNQDAISEIVSLQGHIYRRIALIIIGGACILMLFFPWIFKKMNLPLWYAYVSFGSLLVGSLLGYFVNYKQIVLTANQEDYKVLYSYKSIMLLKVLIQIFAIWKFNDGFIWWAVLEIVFAIIASIALHITTVNNFPFLRKSKLSYKELKNKYIDFSKKIKQLFFHKLGTFVLTQTSPLIIYAYADLTLVALYGNYLIILTGLHVLMLSLFNSINAGVGNFLVTQDKKNVLFFYKELFSVRFLIIAILCFCAYNLSSKFIVLWIGYDFVLPNVTLGLMVLSLFLNLARGTTDSFINGYGLYGDIWSPVVEAVINISSSIFLGYFYGLNGIITGVIISQMLILYIWKPYYLFSRKLKGYMCKYIIMFSSHIFWAILVWIFSEWIINKQLNTISNLPVSYKSFIIQGITYSLVYGIILSIVLCISKCGLNMFYWRIFEFIKKRLSH